MILRCKWAGGEESHSHVFAAAIALLLELPYVLDIVAARVRVDVKPAKNKQNSRLGVNTHAAARIEESAGIRSRHIALSISTRKLLLWAQSNFTKNHILSCSSRTS